MPPVAVVNRAIAAGLIPSVQLARLHARPYTRLSCFITPYVVLFDRTHGIAHSPASRSGLLEPTSSSPEPKQPNPASQTQIPVNPHRQPKRGGPSRNSNVPYLGKDVLRSLTAWRREDVRARVDVAKAVRVEAESPSRPTSLGAPIGDRLLPLANVVETEECAIGRAQ
jgi:hypothetical protein